MAKNMRVVSIDVGIRNLALWVEEVSDELWKLPKSCSLPDIFQTGQTIAFDLIELEEKGKGLSAHVFNRLSGYLSKHKMMWDTCHCFLIERQLYKRNPQSERLSQFIFSYFKITYPHKIVSFFPSKNKTKWLGYEQTVLTHTTKKRLKGTKTDRKRWAVDMALEILLVRKEYDFVEELLEYTKQDDLSDCVCQLQAFKRLLVLKKKCCYT